MGICNPLVLGVNCDVQDLVESEPGKSLGQGVGVDPIGSDFQKMVFQKIQLIPPPNPIESRRF